MTRTYREEYVDSLVSWLEAHDKLAGWAQFVGAMLALAVTYFTAFAPIWRRKRHLRVSAERLLTHGYETLESYHRTSINFLPHPLSLRGAALSMASVVAEMGRFPVFDLDDQGPYSLPRKLLTVSVTLDTSRMLLEAAAADLEGREATTDDQEMIRAWIGERLQTVAALLRGERLQRPIWPGDRPVENPAHSPNQPDA